MVTGPAGTPTEPPSSNCATDVEAIAEPFHIGSGATAVAAVELVPMERRFIRDSLPDDALIMTRNAVKCIVNSYDLKERDIRLFFTGHKGFNIEVLPSALGLAGTQNEQDNKADRIWKKIISELRRNAGLASKPGQCRNLVSEQGTLIDPIHKHVRLHDSINEWIECGTAKARKKIGLTLSELGCLTLENIIAKSRVNDEANHLP